jgi:hypothetical protein
MNIDTTAINHASATIFLPIPCLPFSPVPELRISYNGSTVSNHFSSDVNSFDARLGPAVRVGINSTAAGQTTVDLYVPEPDGLGDQGRQQGS